VFGTNSKKQRKQGWVFASALAFCSASLASAAPPTICERLAVELRQRPLSAWSRPAHAEGAAWPTVRFASDNSARKKYQELSALPEAKAITINPGVGPAMDHVGNFYELYDIGGSTHCEMRTFVHSRRAGEIEFVTAPTMTHTRSLCDGVAGRLARAFGTTVYVETGPSGPEGDDEEYDLVPWHGTDWGRPCAVTVKHSHVLRLTESHCPIDGNCGPFVSDAMRVASAYVAYRADGFHRQEAFRDGPRASAAAAAKALDHWSALQSAHGTGQEYLAVTIWPVFGSIPGDDYEHTFSLTGFRFYTTSIDHSDYAVGVGYAGFGWNESNQILVGYYRIGSDRLEPAAGIAVRREIAGSEVRVLQ